MIWQPRAPPQLVDVASVVNGHIVSTGSSSVLPSQSSSTPLQMSVADGLTAAALSLQSVLLEHEPVLL